MLVIPAPISCRQAPAGTAPFHVPQSGGILAKGSPGLLAVAAYFAQQLAQQAQLTYSVHLVERGVPLSQEHACQHAFRLLLEPSVGYRLEEASRAAAGRGGSPPMLATEEGYEVEVGPSGVTVTAAAPHGIFHGCQTALQLLMADPEGRPGRCMPCIKVRMRGLMHGIWCIVFRC